MDFIGSCFGPFLEKKKLKLLEVMKFDEIEG
jgi:hypothetical protein